MGKHPIKYGDFLLLARETTSKFVRVLVNTCGQRNHDYWFIIFVMSTPIMNGTGKKISDGLNLKKMCYTAKPFEITCKILMDHTDKIFLIFF